MIIKEFKEFISKGNVIDLAVGIIIGASFTGIVKSLVDDIIMPPIGFIVGGVNFTDLKLYLIRGVTINYGNFLQVLFNFLITAFAIFWVVKVVNRLQKVSAKKEAPKEAPKPDPKSDEILLLQEIRDLLKKKS